MAGELRMLDSVTVANLPPGADAYLGYVDGAWPDWAAEVARFPGRPVVGLTVFPGVVADGADCETRDLTVAELADWLQWRLGQGAWRPIGYASASDMQELLDALADLHIDRHDVRLLSAHYGIGRHICAPDVCGFPQADGTQWTNKALGLNGTLIDESLLAADFFGTPPPPPPRLLEDDMLLLTPTIGHPVPLAIPNGAKRLRFYCNSRTVIRVDCFNVVPTAELTLGYGVPDGIDITDKVNAAQVYLVEGAGPVAYVASA